MIGVWINLIAEFFLECKNTLSLVLFISTPSYVPHVSSLAQSGSKPPPPTFFGGTFYLFSDTPLFSFVLSGFLVIFCASIAPINNAFKVDTRSYLPYRVSS